MNTNPTLRRIIRGMGYVPKYGEHPGIFPLVVMSLAGGIAGGKLGAVVVFLCLFPLVLIGAYERGKP